MLITEANHNNDGKLGQTFQGRLHIYNIQYYATPLDVCFLGAQTCMDVANEGLC